MKTLSVTITDPSTKEKRQIMHGHYVPFLAEAYMYSGAEQLL